MNKENYLRLNFKRAVIAALDAQDSRHSRSTKPNYWEGGQQNESVIFTFTRYIKSWVEVNQPDYTEHPEDVFRRVSNVWEHIGKSNMPEWFTEYHDTKEMDYGEWEIEFSRNWYDIKQTLISKEEKAVTLSEKQLFDIEMGPKRRPKRYKECFLNFVASLVYVRQTDEIALPQQLLADLLGTRQATISAYIKWAKEDGFLVKTKNASFRKSGFNQAAYYRVDVSRWPELKGSFSKQNDLMFT